MTRRLWIPLVLGGLAASLGGCNCNPPPKEMTVSITSPKNGATVTMKEDADNSKSGLQFEVKVATTNIATDGTGFAKVLVDGKANNSAKIGADGSAVVTVDTSTLASPDGSHILQAVGGDESGSVESAKVSLTLDSTELTECVVTVTDPQSGAKLNGKSDLMPDKAGVQGTVTIHTSGCGSTGKVRVCMQGQGLTGTACKGNVGIAVGEANISSTNSTTLTVDWPEGSVVVIGEHDNNTKVTDSEAVLVTVDSTGPTCTFVAPLDQAVLSSLNVDVQLKVDGAEAGQPVSVVSTLKPEAQTGTNTETGEVTIAATLPLGEQTLTATVTDANGNTGTCNVTVTVDIEGCDVVLTDPPGGEYLFNIANASPGGTPLMGKYTILGKTKRCAGGTAKFTKTVNGVDSDLGTADVDAGGNFSRLLLFPDGEKDATLTVKIEKTGVASNGGTFFTYSTDFVAPTCAFVSPKDGDTVTAQNTSVKVTVTDAEVDQDVVLATSAKPETMTGKVLQVGGDVTIAASLPLGAQTLTVTVADKAKNSGTCAVNVTVDVAGCDIVLSDPATPELIVNIAKGNPTGSPLEGTYTVKGSSTRCPSGTLTVTKVIGGTAGTPATATVGVDGTFSVPVKFKDGEFNSVIQLKLDKAGMAPGTPTEIAYFSDFTAPSIDQAVPALGNMFVVNASNPHLIAGEAGYVLDEDAATLGGTVTVNVNVTGIGTSASTGYGSALNGSATIKAGANTLVTMPTTNLTESVGGQLVFDEGFAGAVLITLTDSAGNVTTGQWDAKVATAPLPGTLTITNPGAGTINVFKDLGGDRSTYAQVQGVVTFGGITAPSGAQLVLCSTIQYQGSAQGNCPAGYYELPGTRVAASGTSQFYGGLKLPQGVQDIVAVMTDAVGGVITSAAVHLTVDTVPPVVTSVVASNDSNGNGTISGSELAANTDATFVANITGADGQQASFTTTDSTGKVSTVFATVASGVATFVVKGIPDGAFTGKVSVTSANGNPNASTAVSPAIVNATASLTVTFQRVAPSISVVAPNFTVCNQAKQKQPPSGATVCDVDFTVSLGVSATRVDFSLTGTGTFSPASVTSFTSGKATSTFALAQSTAPVTMTARAYDAAGNYRDATWTMTLVDTIAPELTIVAPLNNSIQFTQRFPFSVTTDAEVGQTVTVKSSSNGTVGTGLVVAGSPLNTATFDVNVAGTNQTLTATVADLAGNISPAQSVDIVMNLSGCDVNFINPDSADPIFNATTAPGGLVHITGNTTRVGCESTIIDFTAAINGAAAISVGSATASSGNFAFDYTFPDGSVVVFEGKSRMVGSSPNGFTAITDITPPTLVINAPVPNASKQLFLVAKTGNINVMAGTAGYIPEIDDTVADGQVVFDLVATGAGASAGTGTGTVEIFQGTTSVYLNPSASNAAQALTPTVTLNQAFVGQIHIFATDYAGNNASATWDLTVDVVPPPPPPLATDASATKHCQVINARHSDIDVFWTTPPDDGPLVQTLSWQFGYTSALLLGTSLFDDAAFDNPAITTIDLTLGTVPAAGTVVGKHLTNLPSFNTYSFAPRLVDGVGNRSQLSPWTTVVDWSVIPIAYPGTSTNPAFGNTVAVGGDIDLDGYGDFLVGAPATIVAGQVNAGAIFAFFGGTAPGSRFQMIEWPTASGLFGMTMALGDVTGDSRADILAIANGKARLFVSRTAQPSFASSPDYSFSGPTNISGVITTPDINGDGIREVVLASRTASSGLGAAYLFFGRSDWSSVAVSGVIDVSTADRTILGTDAGGSLGYGSAFSSAFLDGDTLPDLLLPAPGAKKLYIFLGKDIKTSSASVTAANASQSVTFTGFGSAPASCASLDLNNDSLADLLCGDLTSNALYLLPQQLDGSFIVPSYSSTWLQGVATFPSILAAGDLDLDGRPDLAAATNKTTSGFASFLFSRTASPISPPPKSILSGGAAYGSAMGIADLNNDGNVDLVIGDKQGSGHVEIRY